jgi:hypothetical protein
MRRHQTEHSSLCWSPLDPRRHRRTDSLRRLRVGSRPLWTTVRPRQRPHNPPLQRPLRRQTSPSHSHHRLHDSSRLHTLHITARAIRASRSLPYSSLTAYLPNRAHTRTQLRSTIRRPHTHTQDLHLHRSRYIRMGTMLHLNTHHLVLRNRHTLQASSAFHTSRLARNPRVCRAHTSSRDSSTRIPHNRTTLCRLRNMPSHLLKPVSCCRPSRYRPRIRREFIPRQPQQRSTLKCRRPQAIATFRSLAGRRYTPQALADKGLRLCIR